MYGRIYNKRDYSESVHGTIIKGKYEIQMRDCYEAKEQLKELGYKWNACAHAWCLTCKVEEIGNAIADVVVKVNLPKSEYKQMLMHMCSIEIDMSAITMDDKHKAMLAAHYAK